MRLEMANVSRTLRLAHGWSLTVAGEVPASLIRKFVRPAVRAVPDRMARQIGLCRISLVADLGRPEVDSEWTAEDAESRIAVATRGRDEHDIAMELLTCLGQALWEKLQPAQVQAYWLLLDAEFLAKVTGEMDEDALREKRALLGSRLSAASSRRLERYGRASFAATAAEYVHCLWHDVEVVSGPEHLAAPQLGRRLELLAKWFPPNPGQKLFPAPRG
jgi:hypothetical protein